ncbi:MAG: tRNA-specific adenosine deaminase [Crocinitomicaceae bacterium]|nr:tRNA-specific adenosine deaminase [Crocinitomicaceae bacterium]
MVDPFSDEYFMKQALIEAQKAFDADEVPIGAVIVCENKIISRAHNLTERLNDVTAHAEMQAITAAADYLGGKYLGQCTLYVTLEPCVMCAGATMLAHLKGITYGAGDSKKGYARLSESILHKKTKVVPGVLKDECSNLIRAFFQDKRML